MSNRGQVRKAKKFYDIHCHAFNLNHASLMAYARRFYYENKNIIRLYAGGIALGIICILLIDAFFLRYLLPLLHDYLAIFLFMLLFIVLFGIGIISLIYWVKKRKLIKRTVNLWSLMENDLGTVFLYMEKDWMSVKDKELAKSNGFGSMGNDEHKPVDENNPEVLLTPLMMDFGYINTSMPGIHYKWPPSKPIKEQVLDVFYGIKKYRENSKKRLLEIYPFMGLNTQNYRFDANDHSCMVRLAYTKGDLSTPTVSRKKWNISYSNRTKLLTVDGAMDEEIKNGLLKRVDPTDKDALEHLFEKSQNNRPRNNLKKMLEKYFGKYDGNYDTIYQKYEEYFPDKKQNESSFGIDNIEDGFFVGIKLYPPLGFDPWPDESDETWEFKKVNYLYQFCCWKGIPITVHCGGIGFQVINNDLDEKYTNPDKQWRKVLKHYPNLKINFAHMGLRRNYTPTIFEFMKRYANIYTDFSGMALSRKSYKKIISTINAENFSDEQRSRILFGTDFMINLLWIDSLKDYLEEFFKSDLPEKNSYCSTNPEKFLFGRNNKTEKCNPFPIDENGEENTLCSQYHCEKYPG